MEESDKQRILNFLIGNEPIHEFEAWVYNTCDLEKRIGKELYFELIDINYKDKFLLNNLNKVVVGNYISHSDFDDFKYKSVLLDEGWCPERKIEVDLSKLPNTPEVQNAYEIIEEFGGLKFISPYKRENWSLTLVEFLLEPYICQDMSKYGLKKNLVCFATAHNDHIDLYVDSDFKFYQLDNVVSEDLYEFRGRSFKHMMRQLLQLVDEDNFEKVGHIKKKTIAERTRTEMTAKLQLESILSNQYESEDGDSYKIELLDGMTEIEIESLKKQLPNNNLPNEIEELLRFSKGFEFYGLEEVRFDAFDHFGFEEMFPNSIQLAGDGFGNFWILDIDSKGNWNSVYYVCHDPAVIVKHSKNLSEFIKHVDEFGQKGNQSNLNIIHEKTVMDIWSEKVGIMEKNEKGYDFENEQVELPEMYLVADLTDKPIKTGFPWGKSGPNTKIIRPTDKPVWIVEKQVKQGFLSRIFGGKK